jgi:hypothetical protein
LLGGDGCGAAHDGIVFGKLVGMVVGAPQDGVDEGNVGIWLFGGAITEGMVVGIEPPDW